MVYTKNIKNMAKIKTNILEMMLKDFLIGKSFYDNDNNLKIIEDVNFQPLIQTVYVKSGDNGYYFSLNELYYFDLNETQSERIIPNKGKVKNIK